MGASGLAVTCSVTERCVPTPAKDGIKNYMTPAGFRRLNDELAQLWKVERPAMVATVTFTTEAGDERTVTIVGTDELDSGGERVSWRSPLATALLKAQVGDAVTVRTPRGPERIDVEAIRYDALV